LVFLALGIVFGAVVLFLFNPAQNGFYPLCLFYQSTGLLCPGCGSLRAIHQLLHGNLVVAMHYNLLLVLCLPFGAWYGARFGIAKWKGEQFHFHVPNAALWSGLVLLLIFGILRNLPFAYALWLAP
jgi:hypothetical protein